MSECTRQTFGHTDGLRPRRAHSLITTSAVPARQPEGIILVFLLFLTTCTLTETLLTLSNGEARRCGVWVSGIQEGLRRFAVLWDVAVKKRKKERRGSKKNNCNA